MQYPKQTRNYIDSIVAEHCPNGGGGYYATDKLRNQIAADRDKMRTGNIDYFDAVEYLANHWGKFV